MHSSTLFTITNTPTHTKKKKPNNLDTKNFNNLYRKPLKNLSKREKANPIIAMNPQQIQIQQ